MRSPRWRKVLADLKVSRSRTALVILSIAIGVFAVGTMLTARVILQRGVDDSFDAANSASALLMTGSFDEGIVDAARLLPEIDDAEGRANVAARMDGGSEAWLNLDLYAIADFDDIRIDRVLPEDGAWPPATGEILLERLSSSEAKIGIGDTVLVEMPDGSRHSLMVSGLAYDPGKVAPNLSEDRFSGYVSMETLVSIRQPGSYNELRVIATDLPRDLQQGELVAGLTRDAVLEPNGVTVHRIAVHDTPRYHSADLGSALILILGLLGGLILLLGVFLVVNTVNALLAQQVRQIGIMKAIGGQRRQISGLYVALVLGYGILAVVIAVPLAALAGVAFSNFFADLLNFQVRGSWFPPPVIAIELALGLLIPVLAALVPITRGTRITVREALTSYGLSERPYRPGVIDRLLGRIRGLPRPVVLSLRNTFRRRGRLALTLITLTLGGAIFASVATIQSSLDKTFSELMQYTSYDVEISLSDPVSASDAILQVSMLPEVERAEGWLATNASRLRPDGTQNSNIWMLAPPADSSMIQPTLVEGRWLESGETESFVVNVDFRRDESDISVGDLVTLKVQGQELTWPVVGIVTSQLTGPVVYAAYEPFSQALGFAGEIDRIVLVTASHGDAAQLDAAQAAEQQLRASGFPVAQVNTESELRSGTESLFDILVVLLLVVSILLVIVGSLGLAGAMSLNVIERTREIGLMRAIGASNGMVAKIVIIEGLVVGLLSWILGALIAVPLSWVLTNLIGVAFLQVPLAYTFSATGLILWLALVIVLSVVASLLPARSAWRLRVREVLAYE